VLIPLILPAAVAPALIAGDLLERVEHLCRADDGDDVATMQFNNGGSVSPMILAATESGRGPDSPTIMHPQEVMEAGRIMVVGQEIQQMEDREWGSRQSTIEEIEMVGISSSSLT